MMGHPPIIPNMASGDLDGPPWPSLFSVLGLLGLLGWWDAPTYLRIHAHFQLRALPRIVAQQSWHARPPWKFDAAGTNILDSTLIRSHEGFMRIKIRSRSRDRSLPKEKG